MLKTPICLLFCTATAGSSVFFHPQMQNGQNGQANGFQKHRVFVDEEQTKNCLTNLQINRCFYLID
jgi:hypothetical protein